MKYLVKLFLEDVLGMDRVEIGYLPGDLMRWVFHIVKHPSSTSINQPYHNDYDACAVLNVWAQAS